MLKYVVESKSLVQRGRHAVFQSRFDLCHAPPADIDAKWTQLKREIEHFRDPESFGIDLSDEELERLKRRSRLRAAIFATRLHVRTFFEGLFSAFSVRNFEVALLNYNQMLATEGLSVQVLEECGFLLSDRVISLLRGRAAMEEVRHNYGAAVESSGEEDAFKYFEAARCAAEIARMNGFECGIDFSEILKRQLAVTAMRRGIVASLRSLKFPDDSLRETLKRLPNVAVRVAEKAFVLCRRAQTEYGADFGYLAKPIREAVEKYQMPGA